MRFTKAGKVRFTSHRDVARMWERALRKASVPAAYTEGFSPRPKLHFGLALSVGHESLAEYLDLDLDDARLDTAPDTEKLAVALDDALPEGIDVVAAAVIDRREPSLQQVVTSCTWSITIAGAARDELAERVAALLDATTLPVTLERKGKRVNDDLRPQIVSLQLPEGDSESPPLLVAELATQPRSARPSELLAALSERWAEARVCRQQQWIAHDGDRREPLAPGVESWARTEVRAP